MRRMVLVMMLAALVLSAGCSQHPVPSAAPGIVGDWLQTEVSVDAGQTWTKMTSATSRLDTFFADGTVSFNGTGAKWRQIDPTHIALISDTGTGRITSVRTYTISRHGRLLSVDLGKGTVWRYVRQ